MSDAPTIGEAFPADDVLARWMIVVSIARNDLALATERIVRANEDDDGTNVHWHRLLAAHFFEAGRFLRRTKGITEVMEFVSGMSQESQDDYQAVLQTAKRWSEKRLRRGRNRTFHYVDIAEAPGKQRGLLRCLRRRRPSLGIADIESALAEVGDRPAEIYGSRKTEKNVSVDRFLFADEVAGHFAISDLGEDATELDASLERIRNEEVRFVHFANAAIDRYQEERGFHFPTV